MLSYRHSFHAGNFADVLKHIVVIEILEYLTRKEKPFDYIDTHAGAGLYDLQSDHATKLNEADNGFKKLNPNDWPELSSYFEVIDCHNPSGEQNQYPGSPLFAQHMLREQDRAWLFELHPRDVELLEFATAKDKRIRVEQKDGFKGLISLLPPSSRRGLILIDPSYEVKSDYEAVFKVIVRALRRFGTGTFALWYPVVDRQRIDQLENNFIKSGIKNIQRFELGLAPDSDARGMTASGMIVVNPPWVLRDKMNQLLPKLTDTLGEGDGAFFKSGILVDE